MPTDFASSGLFLQVGNPHCKLLEQRGDLRRGGYTGLEQTGRNEDVLVAVRMFVGDLLGL